MAQKICAGTLRFRSLGLDGQAADALLVCRGGVSDRLIHYFGNVAENKQDQNQDSVSVSVSVSVSMSVVQAVDDATVVPFWLIFEENLAKANGANQIEE